MTPKLCGALGSNGCARESEPHLSPTRVGLIIASVFSTGNVVKDGLHTSRCSQNGLLLLSLCPEWAMCRMRRVPLPIGAMLKLLQMRRTEWKSGCWGCCGLTMASPVFDAIRTQEVDCVPEASARRDSLGFFMPWVSWVPLFFWRVLARQLWSDPLFKNFFTCSVFISLRVVPLGMLTLTFGSTVGTAFRSSACDSHYFLMS